MGNYENINENLKQIDWYKWLENINAENTWAFLKRYSVRKWKKCTKK